MFYSSLQRHVTFGYAEGKAKASDLDEAQTANLARGSVEHVVS